MSKLKRGLIVSCQAVKGEPLYGYNVMHLFAKAVVEGGAVGIRALGEDIPLIRSMVDVPIIGITKTVSPDSEVYITPALNDIQFLLKTDCQVIAMDATPRYRNGGVRLEEIVKYVRSHAPERELMADIATLADAENAVRLGFDYVSTTLRGYTAETKGMQLPDIGFMREVKELLRGTDVKMVAEGGINECDQLREIKRIDPYAVVIGSAITRPKLICERFAAALAECGE